MNSISDPVSLHEAVFRVVYLHEFALLSSIFEYFTEHHVQSHPCLPVLNMLATKAGLDNYKVPTLPPQEANLRQFKTPDLYAKEMYAQVDRLLNNGRYADAIGLLEETDSTGLKGISTIQNMEKLLQCLLLGNLEDEYKEIDTKLDSYVISCLSEVYIHKLSAAEREAYGRCKQLIVLGLFVNGNYLEVWQMMQVSNPLKLDFVDEARDTRYNQFVTHQDMLDIISISTFITLPLKGLPQPLDEWQTIAAKMKKRWQFHQIVENFSMVIRMKMYVFYLKLSSKISSQILAEMMSLPQELVDQEVKMLIKECAIDFTADGDTFTYQQRDPRSFSIEKLVQLQNQITASIKKAKQANEKLKTMAQSQIVENHRRSVDAVVGDSNIDNFDEDETMLM